MLANLIVDCCKHIFAYLDKWDLMSLRQTNRSLKEKVEEFFQFDLRTLDLNDILNRNFTWLLHNFHALKSLQQAKVQSNLNFPNFFPGNSTYRSTFNSRYQIKIKSFAKMTSLKELSTDFNFSDDDFQIIAKNCSKLEHLRLKCCRYFTDVSLYTIGTYLKNLKCIQMEVWSNYTTGHPLVFIFENCLHLEEISMSGNVFTDKSLNAIAQYSTKLKCLNIPNCSKVTDQALIEVVQKWGSQLEELNVMSVAGITDRFLYCVGDVCKQLKSLNVVECEHITDYAVHHVLVNCSQLEKICAPLNRWCFQSVPFHSKMLKYFDFSMVTNCVACSIARNCLKLEDITLVSFLEFNFFMTVADNCKFLRKIVFFNFENVEDLDPMISLLAVNCTHLEELDFRYADITDISLICIAENLNLKVLMFNHCNKITDMGVSQIALKFLTSETLNLCITQGQITNFSIECIAENLRALKELWLSIYHVACDVGIKKLAKCPSLRLLSINQTGSSLSKAAIDYLKKHSTRLYIKEIE